MAASEKIHPYLVVTRVGQSDQVILWDTLRIHIGRHPEQDLVLPETEISREHALLKREGGQFAIEDLHTANHTYVNGQRITKSILTPNDVIAIGDWKIRFCVSKENPTLRMPRAKYASQLKDYRIADEEDGARTMLGVEIEEDPVLAKKSEKKPYRVPDLRQKIEAEIPAKKLDLKNQGLEALNGMSFRNAISGFDFSEHSPTVPDLHAASEAAPDFSPPGASPSEPSRLAAPPPMATPAPPVSIPAQESPSLLDSASDFEFGIDEPVLPAEPPAPAVREEAVTQISITRPTRRASRAAQPSDLVQSTPKSVEQAPTLRDVAVTLQLQGVSDELLQLLESLQDRKLDLRELAIVLQSIVVKK